MIPTIIKTAALTIAGCYIAVALFLLHHPGLPAPGPDTRAALGLVGFGTGILCLVLAGVAQLFPSRFWPNIAVALVAIPCLGVASIASPRSAPPGSHLQVPKHSTVHPLDPVKG